MKRKLLASAVLLGLAGMAQAAPFSLPGGGPVYIKMNNMEQIDASGLNTISAGPSIDVNGDGILDTPTTEGNWGIFRLTTVSHGTDPTGTPNDHTTFNQLGDIWTSSSGGSITGIFYGITTTGGGGSITTATGGWLDLWWHDTTGVLVGDKLPSARSGLGPNIFDGITNTVGNVGDATTLLARFRFVPGAADNDALNTLTSSSDLGTGIYNNTVARSFLEVVDINNDGVIDALDGYWAGVLNTDWFYTKAGADGIAGNNDGGVDERPDVSLNNRFNSDYTWDAPGGCFFTGGTSYICGVNSDDPIRAMAVPEPTSIALLGLGLVGVGALRRRQAAKEALLG